MTTEIESAPPSRAPRDPQRFSVATSIARSWPLVLVLALVLAAAGIFYASTRELTYRAQAQYTVGPTATNPQAISGTLDAATSLASSYARFGGTREVLDTVARQLDRDPVDVADHVTLGALNGNPILQVEGRAGSPAAAVLLARTYGRVLQNAVGAQIDPDQQSSRQLQRYRDASARVSETRAAVTRLQRADASPSELRGPRAEAAAATLRRDVAADVYAQSQQRAQGVVGLTSFDPARVVGDDETDLYLRYGAAGLVAGALLGLLLAAAIAATRRRRLLRGA